MAVSTGAPVTDPVAPEPVAPAAGRMPAVLTIWAPAVVRSVTGLSPATVVATPVTLTEAAITETEVTSPTPAEPA